MHTVLYSIIQPNVDSAKFSRMWACGSATLAAGALTKRQDPVCMTPKFREGRKASRSANRHNVIPTISDNPSTRYHYCLRPWSAGCCTPVVQNEWRELVLGAEYPPTESQRTFKFHNEAEHLKLRLAAPRSKIYSARTTWQQPRHLRPKLAAGISATALKTSCLQVKLIFVTNTRRRFVRSVTMFLLTCRLEEGSLTHIVGQKSTLTSPRPPCS